MTRRAGTFCALILLCALTPPMVAARPVYRCGPDDARTYSHTPCRDDNGRVVDVADPRDAEQWSEAADVAQRAADTGRKMEKERRRNESARKRAIGIGIGGAGPAAGDAASNPADRKPKTVRPVKTACPKGTARVPPASATSRRSCPPRKVSPKND